MPTNTAGQAGTEYASTAAVARRLGVASATVRALVNDGALVGVRVGRLLRVELASVDAYLEAQRVAGGAR